MGSVIPNTIQELRFPTKGRVSEKVNKKGGGQGRKHGEKGDDSEKKGGEDLHPCVGHMARIIGGKKITEEEGKTPPAGGFLGDKLVFVRKSGESREYLRRTCRQKRGRMTQNSFCKDALCNDRRGARREEFGKTKDHRN